MVSPSEKSTSSLHQLSHSWSIPRVSTFQTFGFEKLKIYKEIVTDPESHCGKTVPIPCPKHKHIKHAYMEAVCSEIWNRSLGLKKKNQLPTPCVTLGKSFNTLILQLLNCIAKKKWLKGPCEGYWLIAACKACWDATGKRIKLYVFKESMYIITLLLK